MAKLIDANKFKDEMQYVCDAGGWLEPVTKAVTEYVKKQIDAQPTVDAIPISFIQQEIDRYYKDESITTTGTLNNWIFRSKRLGLQYLIERWKQEQEKQNEKAEI